jgi:SAM-dependent methyltransferase
MIFDPTDYWQTRLEENPGIEGVGYLGLGPGYNNVLYSLRREVFQRNIRSLDVVPTEMNVLDVGSGTGFYLAQWRELGFRDLTACDLTPVAVDRLAKAFPDVSVQVVDIGDDSIELPLAHFDIISAMDMLFHIVDDSRWSQALTNLSGLLRPGGHLVMSDNFPSSLAQAEIGKHQSARTQARYVTELSRVGLEVVSVRPMFVLMNGPVGAGVARTFLWGAFAKVLALNGAVATSLGRALLPVERRLVQRRQRSHTTEIMVCRKSLVTST